MSLAAGSTIIPAASDAANVSMEIAFFIIRVPVSSSKVAVVSPNALVADVRSAKWSQAFALAKEVSDCAIAHG